MEGLSRNILSRHGFYKLHRTSDPEDSNVKNNGSPKAEVCTKLIGLREKQ